MSKVICDVCGTTYPETATQCPICGSAKNSTAPTAAGGEEQLASYAYVKGGRFSKTNVRKHTKRGEELDRRPAGEPKPKNEVFNIILITTIILLVIAIIAVVGYIGVRAFMANNQNNLLPQTTEPTTNLENPQDPNNPDPNGNAGIPCTEIKLDKTSFTFDVQGHKAYLSCTVTPANTTDQLTYESSDETVATVTDQGLVTAVGGGQAIITVKCGKAQAQCQVICTFGEPVTPTEPTEPTEPPVVVPEGFELKLKHTDITISKSYPDPVSLFASNSFGVKSTDITWTSSDESVATVSEKGVVSPVSKGTATIRATIGDQTATCKVYVSFTPEPVVEKTYKISHTDVTLKVGQSFNIFLSDSDGVNVTGVEWVASVEGYVTINGRNIKGAQATADQPGRYITITAVVNDEVYTCIVRVVDAE